MSEKKNKPIIESVDLTRWREAPFLMIKGFIMGSADIIPGVSGGTIAFITGIYDRLIFAIKSFDANAVSSLLKFRIKEFFTQFHWKFFVILGCGMLLAIVFFTRIVPLQVYMFTHAELVYGLFFGLIVGSVFLLMSEINKSERSWKFAFPLLAGTLFGFWLIILVPANTPESFWFVFLSGSIAISAMLLPGISGSYLLLIFGKYDYILHQLSLLGTPDTWEGVINLAPFVLGLITGLIVFSRILTWFLKNFHSITIVVLIGFLIGSLYMIWPFQDREYEEIIVHTEILPINDPLVQTLMQQDEPVLLPDFQRIGRIHADDESVAETAEIETISRKITSNEPFLPWTRTKAELEKVDIRAGITGMVIGLCLIMAISWLRKKS